MSTTTLTSVRSGRILRALVSCSCFLSCSFFKIIIYLFSAGCTSLPLPDAIKNTQKSLWRLISFAHNGRVTHTDTYNESFIAFYRRRGNCARHLQAKLIIPHARASSLSVLLPTYSPERHTVQVFQGPPKVLTGRESVHQRGRKHPRGRWLAAAKSEGACLMSPPGQRSRVPRCGTAGVAILTCSALEVGNSESL